MARWMTGPSAKRIAERHTQFNHIRARVNRRKRNLARRLERRIARSQIDHQTRLVIETYRH